ncbi:peptidyl-tRNA hydrolase [Balneicella halophila]|uniref:Peptidyl-tRNA hydrolase n=1 Tax=Balneicella halophila TaxID=1537566 RepID=A0A7L4UR73_BALHA|nr:aminoacyl-tRNA hydrolase [Balneicella halophila]PVX52250.1 peptidyl-tRNA hydrolase [Balneicella halophila]
MKYLVVGIGNIGYEYMNTRHNIGFEVLDTLAEKAGLEFKSERYGARAQYRFKGRIYELLKPNTFVNLSGKAVNYWLQKEKIPQSNLLIIVDDLALPFGTLRLKLKGSDAGHNGLKDINAVLGNQNYARLRFGIGDSFSRGHQVDYVLGKWEKQEQEHLPLLIDKCIEVIRSFGTIGASRTMNTFNKDYLPKEEE